MGIVVKVIDRALDNEICVIKVLHSHQAMDEITVARFRNEVILARRLSHPSIVRIHDLGTTAQGQSFISMEYVAGSDLRSHIIPREKSALTDEWRIKVLHQTALGLAHAHEMDVIHRDLKPENILLDYNGRVKIADFGLARSLLGEKGFTATGETVGTPCYMAPEQLRGEKLDGRCDVYALGIIAFELFSGDKPFYHENYLTLADMHIQSPVPKLRAKHTSVPKWVDVFIEKCAAKKVRDRYAGAAQAAQFLAGKM